MHVTFFAAEKDREDMIARAFATGVRTHSHQCDIVRPAEYPAPNPETDVAVMIGVKGYSRKLFDDHLEAGKHVLYIDKGYLGNRGRYYRMSVNSFQPLRYFQQVARPADRLQTLGLTLQPMRTSGRHILVAGGSVKYSNWHRMHGGPNDEDPATAWAQQTIKRLSKASHRPIVYRPKPSWKDAVPIPGVEYSRPPRTIQEELRDCWCLVTYGSNAALDALIFGVPVLVLGDGIAQPLAKMSENSVEDPYLPTDEERWQLLADVAYCQFSVPEMASGLAWSILQEQLHADGAATTETTQTAA